MIILQNQPTYITILTSHKTFFLTSIFSVAGYREKVFAIIGVKVYAAGFYAEPSIGERLDAWKGKPAAEILEDGSLFNLILQGIN